MSDEQTGATEPSPEELAALEAQAAAAQEVADEIVTLSIPDLTARLEGLDLLTLRAALIAEEAKGDAARTGAVTAIEAAIDAHPDQVAALAAVEPAINEAEPLAPEQQPEPGVSEQPQQEEPEKLAAVDVGTDHVLMDADDRCTDAYPVHEETGHYLVPLGDIATMQSHGFRVVAG